MMGSSWNWMRRMRRRRRKTSKGDIITLADSLPKSLARPWPPLALPLPWDFPLLPTHSTPTSNTRGRICFVTLDGHLLKNYALSTDFTMDALAIFSEFKTAHLPIQSVLSRFTVEQGMPPTSNPWVIKNIVKEVLKSWPLKSANTAKPAEFVEALRGVLMGVAMRLKTTPLKMAHTVTTYDGKSLLQFLTNKHQMIKALEMTWKSLPKEEHGKLIKEYVGVALDILSPATGLPHCGTVQEMDKIVSSELKMVDGVEGGVLNRKEFKKVMVEVVGRIMNELERNPVSVSSDVVITKSIVFPTQEDNSEQRNH
ncbi:hypothetical protein SUGI_0750380 [Cryptomeria japonica]|uniref:uncharacterized protein LOC131078444 n=1 Tax=Cryptomeria japonica TaxID=3369 RepID=UPI0024148993|nr:uncharacterized protein LOC131078444 [Cryptomeria japonica]GLJ37032.1 hypothetical protein SUGI_0750380 [Cryptomeria japonica]